MRGPHDSQLDNWTHHPWSSLRLLALLILRPRICRLDFSPLMHSKPETYVWGKKGLPESPQAANLLPIGPGSFRAINRYLHFSGATSNSSSSGQIPEAFAWHVNTAGISFTSLKSTKSHISHSQAKCLQSPSSFFQILTVIFLVPHDLSVPDPCPPSPSARIKSSSNLP